MTGRETANKGKLRGQPIAMLVMLALLWGGARYLTWSVPYSDGSSDQASTRRVAPLIVDQQAEAQPEISRPSSARIERAAPASGFGDPSHWQTPEVELPATGGSWSDPEPLASQSPANPAPGADEPRQRMAAGHALLMAAGLSQMEVPPPIAAAYRRAQASGNAPLGAQGENPLLAAAKLSGEAPYLAAPAMAEASGQSRWSGDGWLLWRDDTTTPITSGRPSYGRSQLGAVVRYELAPSTGNRPQAYLRGSAALQGAREQEVAAGLSARPLARVPIRLAAEVRVSERAGGREVRPAAFAVTELAPQQLPGGLQAELYAQAGYVGGDFATAFVDGQARVDGSLASAHGFDLRAGASAWGGAQEDGERLDVGPSASVTFRLGEARGRLAADYRFRVAGNAEPASGPALTLSAGF